MTDSPQPGRPTAVVLVHGTWGRRSRWTFPGSPLHEALRVALPEATIGRFEWSGRNRHRDRIDAAEGLAAELRGSGARTLVVAHSHGGNVALMAVGSLPSAIASRHTIMTLGTPFFHVSRFFNLKLKGRYSDSQRFAFERLLRTGSAERWQARHPFSVTRLLTFSAAIVVALLMLRGLRSLGQVTGVEPDGAFEWAPLTGLSAVLTDASLVIGQASSTIIAVIGLVAVVTFLLTRALIRRSIDDAYHWVGRPGGVEVPTLVIGTARDEAAIGLRIGQTIGGAAMVASGALDRVFNDGRGRGIAPILLVLIASGLLLGGSFGGGIHRTGTDEANEGMLVFVNVVLSDNIGHVGDEFIAIVGSFLMVGAVIGWLLLGVIALEYVVGGIDGVAFMRQARLFVSANAPNVHERCTIELTPQWGPRHSRLLSDAAALAVVAERAQQGSQPGDDISR